MNQVIDDEADPDRSTEKTVTVSVGEGVFLDMVACTPLTFQSAQMDRE